jgi:dTDP-4-amino-4,6-dideoxygalactose transaminase
MIPVTKTFLPPFEEYTQILKRAWDKQWITNNGELLQELELKLSEYLGVKNLLFCGNGTIVLQLTLKALNITGEVITTPFSYVATTNVLLWEGCTPVFVDINENDFCMNAEKIESAITPHTQAILATHVYGNPCNIEKIEAIAKKHNLKVIYDGAHSYGTLYNGKQLLSYGDVATCSFHATKIFHTVEGGCIIVNDNELAEKIRKIRSFGHVGDDYFAAGINGKNSEFHAAMGLANLPHFASIKKNRQEISELYDKHLSLLHLQRPIALISTEYNFAYYPIVLKTENILLNIIEALGKENIVPRRYFYPSLNKLPYLQGNFSCPVSESVANRVLCLPLFFELESEKVELICEIIKANCN